MSSDELDVPGRHLQKHLAPRGAGRRKVTVLEARSHFVHNIFVAIRHSSRRFEDGPLSLSCFLDAQRVARYGSRYFTAYFILVNAVELYSTVLKRAVPSRRVGRTFLPPCLTTHLRLCAGPQPTRQLPHPRGAPLRGDSSSGRVFRHVIRRIRERIHSWDASSLPASSSTCSPSSSLSGLNTSLSTPLDTMHFDHLRSYSCGQ